MSGFLQKIVAFLLSVVALFGVNVSSNLGSSVEKDGLSYTIYDNKNGSDTIIFAFPANPTTGCSWAINQVGISIEQTDDEYKQKPGTEGLCGAGGTEYFTYKATTEGSTKLVFTYGQQWKTSSFYKKAVVVISTDSEMNIKVNSFKVTQY